MHRVAATVFAIAALASSCSVTADPAFGPSTLLTTLSADTQPVTIWLVGDSTGNERQEWFCSTMEWLADQLPAYSLAPVAWNHGRQSWEPSLTSGGTGCTVRTGAGGDRRVGTSATARLAVRGNPNLDIPGDIDVRAKIAPAAWGVAMTQTVAAKFGRAGDQSWRLLLKDGRLVLERTADGIATTTVVSTIAPGFADGTPGWVRFTLGADNGAGGSTVRFLTSTDGVRWLPLGAPVTTSATSATSATFASDHDIEIGTHSNGADPLIGWSYYLEVRNGIDGIPVAAVDLDSAPARATSFVDLLGNTVDLIGAPEVRGAPGLMVYNASVPGETVLYPADPTRFAKLTAVPADLAFISFGHNHGTVPSMWQPYERLVEALEEKWPKARIVAVAQSPQTPPRTGEQIAAHANRTKELVALAERNRIGLLDAYTPMAANPALYVSAEDGIHPTEAGNRLWRDVAVSFFQKAPH